ncbi:thioredoxin family protein [Ectobacillus ponti]|uniref:Thioredoxin family protein n=1 Tax=Ectobacillus ponti TaxID=2961894 RepID=A0AA41X8H0_9BACI|nr:thioredoxin family protein [Ectobacillus ponti]MCP8968629.1 thioredoxin family protein [Ectobacillus ponti]
MTLLDWFAKGMTYEAYVDSMTVNKEELQHIYDSVQLVEEANKVFTKAQGQNWKVVVLTADWCGDAMLCVPIMQRLCELAGFETRFLVRDENLELMDQYLTNGTSRAIPIFIFMDEAGNEKMVWGPRSPRVQELITAERAALPPQDDPSFADRQKEMYGRFRKVLTTDAVIWRSVMESVTDRLQQVL